MRRRMSLLMMGLAVSLASFATGLLGSVDAFAQGGRPQFATPFEKSDGWETVEYAAAIGYYRELAEASPRVTIRQMGQTDSGFPLHLVLISDDETLELNQVTSNGRSVMLINNAIHPGEPDGVDASMQFARDLAMDPERYDDALNNVIVAIIPIYNIGGALNRNAGSRANQNGPREYGFRGNARNYDLNRDFVKCDTLNAVSFAEIFHRLDPALLIDTHVSNGADYQHVMTTSQSQKDKLGLRLGRYFDETFEPRLFARMKEAGYPTIPYVNSGGRPPDQGFTQFLETPRYSTGYAALFQTMGFMTETHMLKPYPERVKATYEFLRQAIALLAEESQTVRQIRRADRQQYRRQGQAPIAWRVDRNRASRLEFHGYEADYVDSRVTPGKRLRYDQSRPFVRNIAYFNHYRASDLIELPAAYLIPRQWQSVIRRMKFNRVEMTVVQKETTLPVEIYRIEKVNSRSAPFEGHYFHDTVAVTAERQEYTAEVGDVIVPIDQDRARYAVETLEPTAMDSLFRWNFFDSVLQRKEHFSPYVFEDSAEKMLASDSQLRSEFDAKKKDDAEFAADRNAQLDFLYRRSKHSEQAYRRYPVVRLLRVPEQ